MHEGVRKKVPEGSECSDFSRVILGALGELVTMSAMYCE